MEDVTQGTSKIQEIKNQGMLRRIRGQGMTEYIIIVALIAVSAIGVFKFFGQTVSHQVAGLAQEISGQDASEITTSQTAAKSAVTQAAKNKTMGSYNDGNH